MRSEPDDNLSVPDDRRSVTEDSRTEPDARVADAARVPRPQGDYVPAVAAGGVVVTAGMTPRVDGVMQHPGAVGREVDLSAARQAAALAAGNALIALQSALKGRTLVQLLRMTVYVHAVPGFTQHSAVADGASRVLVDRLGDRGVVSRSAVGVAGLPGDACVEIELTGVYREGRDNDAEPRSGSVQSG